MKKEANKFYKEIIYDLGDVRHDTYPLFEFEKIEGDFENVIPGCGGCTFPSIKSNGDVYGYININSAVGRDFKDGKKRNVGVFKKDMNVYLQDGKPMYIKNKKGINVKNPDKDYVSLILTGNVIV